MSQTRRRRAVPAASSSSQTHPAKTRTTSSFFFSASRLTASAEEITALLRRFDCESAGKMPGDTNCDECGRREGLTSKEVSYISGGAGSRGAQLHFVPLAFGRRRLRLPLHYVREGIHPLRKRSGCIPFRLRSFIRATCLARASVPSTRPARAAAFSSLPIACPEPRRALFHPRNTRSTPLRTAAADGPTCP